MPAVKLTAFSGEQPRIIPRLLPETAAKSAINARLTDGGLSPFRQPGTIFSFGLYENAGYQTIYRFGSEWLAFENVVHLAPGPVATDRLYYTGDGVPKMRVGSTIYNLEVPVPNVALTATPQGGGAGDVFTRIYVFTWVTAFGEESEPSLASSEISWQASEDVVLSGFPAVPTGRAITLQRIYRSQTGPQGTDFYFIAERDAGTGDFTDDIGVGEFAEVLPSRNWNPPPDDLDGLIALPNGIMAAFTGKQLCFCEPYRPHAWPEIYRLTTNTDIVALGAIDTSVVVATEGQPWLAEGTTPETMQMREIEANLPCINARGVVDLGFGIAWPSNDGLALFGPGGPRIVTQNLFEPKDWRLLNPGTMRGSQYQGRWIGAYNAVDEDNNAISGSLIFDVSGSAAFLIRSDVAAQAWFYEIESNDLFYLDPDGDTIKQFDPSNGSPAQLYWRSKEFRLPKPDNFGCILVETGEGLSDEEIAAREAEIAAIIALNAAAIAAGSIGGDLGGSEVGIVPVGGDTLLPVPASAGTTISIGVYADRVKVASIGTTNRAVRLPAGFLGQLWEIDVFGDIAIEQITMAKTMGELAQVP